MFVWNETQRGEAVALHGVPADRLIVTGAQCFDQWFDRSPSRERARFCLDAGLPDERPFILYVCSSPFRGSPPEADFINTCAEANDILRRLDHPNFVLHLDVKAMSTDDGPAADLIRRHGARAGHFHANDVNRRGPGFGDTDFVPIFRALKESGYRGWVSVEVFDYSPDPETIARESIRYMRECAAKAGL